MPKLGRADVPESLELALSTAMAKSAASRYSSAHAFALALQRIQAELNLSVTPFEVLEEPRAEEHHPDDGFEETRVRSVASIDPDATGSTPTFPARVPNPDAGPTATMPRRSSRNAASNSTGFNNAASTQQSRGPRRCPGSTPPAGTPHGPARTTSRPRSTAPAPLRSASRAAGGRQRGRRRVIRRARRGSLLSIVGGTVLVAAVVLGIVAGTTRPEPAPKPRTRSASRPRTPWTTAPSRTSPGSPARPGRPGKSFHLDQPAAEPGDTYKWRVHTLKGDGQYQATAGPAAEMAANPAEPSCIQVMIVRSDGASSPLGPDSIACVPK